MAGLDASAQAIGRPWELNTAILVAAGSSRRMGEGQDKLLLPLQGIPVVVHTWRRFDACSFIDEIILVIRKERLGLYREFHRHYSFAKPFQLVEGGAERQDSVWNGLQATHEQTEIVLIQDAARPTTPTELIEEAIQGAKTYGAAVVSTQVTDTIKEVDESGWVVRTLDRSRLRAVQTPQAFQKDILVRAMQTVIDRGLHITDDTAACELIGQPVFLIHSSHPNPKLTTPSDVAQLEALLSRGSD